MKKLLLVLLLSTGLYASQEENNDDTFDRNFDPDFLIGDLNSNAAFPTDLMTLHDGSRELSYIQNASTGARDNEYSDDQNVPITNPINVRQSTLAKKRLAHKDYKRTDEENENESEDSSDKSESEYSGESESEDSSDETEYSYDESEENYKEKRKKSNTALPKTSTSTAHTTTKVVSTQNDDTAKKKYQCEKCNRSFIYPSDFKRHEETHSGKKIFKCTHQGCNDYFIYRPDFKKHEETHSGKKIFKCTHQGCNDYFIKPNHLKKHALTHNNKKLFKCKYEECDYSTNYLHDLKRHTKALHPQESDDQNSPITNPKNVQLSTLAKKRLAHEAYKGKYSNEKSESEDSSNESEENYKEKRKKSNTAKKKYQCEKCNQSFIYPSDFKRHVKRLHPQESDDSEHEEE